MASMSNDIGKAEFVYFKKYNIAIKRIYTGQYHSFATTDNGEIYSWGNSNWGEFGPGEYDGSEIPKLYSFFKGKKILKLVFGAKHTIALVQN